MEAKFEFEVRRESDSTLIASDNLRDESVQGLDDDEIVSNRIKNGAKG